jgi:hypothetical protein
LARKWCAGRLGAEVPMPEPGWFDEGLSCGWLIGMVLRGNVSRTKAGRRKLRLFACACCRKVWDLLDDQRMRHAVEVAERFAEGLAGKSELEKAYKATNRLRRGSFVPEDPEVSLNTAASMAAWSAYPKPSALALHMTMYPLPLAGQTVGGKTGDAVIAGVIRCVFPDPSRTTTKPATWRDRTVKALAQAAYDERLLPSGELDPERLAILADAIEDAGAGAGMLTHLRTPGPHIRGCWVVDECLGIG